MTLNNDKHQWFISCNNGYDDCGFNCRGGHKEWEENQRNKKLFQFANYATVAVIKCSYLVATSEETMGE